MLYIIPTPIGNLGDFTLRAIETLKSVSLILCEDTRVARKLLSHYDIKTSCQSFYAYNEHRKVDEVINRLKNEEDIALISDAGTPGISDPGYLLSQACHEHSLAMTCLPGPNALLPALVISGLPCDRFYFEGFLPQKKGRQKRLQFLATLDCTIALYESPYRIEKCLTQLSDHFGSDCPASVVKEISKIHEKVLTGSLSDLQEGLEEFVLKGEFVILIAPQLRVKEKKKKYSQG